jgi:GT2 family glycosyltransferase
LLTSIILVTHESLAYLKDCLAHIEAYTTSPYQLIIVDNASHDGTVDWLKRYSKAEHGSWLSDLKVIYNLKNKFFTKAVNQGLLKANGEYVAIINADVIVTREWLTTILKRFEQLPDAAAIGPMIGGETEKSHYYHQGYETRYGKPPFKYPPDENLQDFVAEHSAKHKGDYTEAKVLCFACAVLRKNAIDKIGGLDEGFILSGDDWEWCLRARTKGFHLFVAEEAFVLHYRKGSIKTLPDKERGKLKMKDQEHWVEVLYKYHHPKKLPEKRLSFGQIYGRQTPFLDVGHTHPELHSLLSWNDIFANSVPFYYSGVTHRMGVN